MMLDREQFSLQMARMIKAIAILFVSGVAMITAGCETDRPGESIAQSAAAQRDYEVLSGTWQLTRGVDNGKAVPARVAQNTILITDYNTFRFPKASGIGTHPAGRFSVNPDTRPKQVDTIAEGGPNAGQLTRGIYEIINATHKARLLESSGRPASDRVQVASWKRTDSSILEENRTCTLRLVLRGLDTLVNLGTDKSDARTHRTPKHFVRNESGDYLLFPDSFGSAHASSRRFFARDAQLFAMLRLK
jgi:uncharacterized protein (TIGR03067 family)